MKLILLRGRTSSKDVKAIGQDMALGKICGEFAVNPNFQALEKREGQDV
jgi:hypothetical protein